MTDDDRQRVLNSIVVGLFQRTDLTPDQRPAKIGRLTVIDRPDQAAIVFSDPDTFQKDYSQVALVGESRFNLNGADWLRARARTQRLYSRAGGPANHQTLADIYAAELDAMSDVTVPDLEAALARAALRVFFFALGVNPDTAAFLDLFQQMRHLATGLQSLSWAAENGETVGQALGEKAALLTRTFGQLCAADPGLSDVIADMRSQATPGDDIVSDLMTNMFAGVETTTAALGWAIDRLGISPPVEDRIHAEVQATPDDTPYLSCFLMESLRAFPPIPFVVRRVAQQTDALGVPLAKGDLVLLSIIGLHRDAGDWTEPQIFHASRPEFLTNPAPPRSFVPFLTGPRVCGGRRLAEVEMLAALRLIVRRFQFETPARLTPFTYALAMRPVLAGHRIIRRD
jgi:cytochrome P450